MTQYAHHHNARREAVLQAARASAKRRAQAAVRRHGMILDLSTPESAAAVLKLIETHPEPEPKPAQPFVPKYTPAAMRAIREAREAA